MTIATRLPKSWSIPKFDIKDPSLVLYLPLWHPYSDMAGSTIYSYDTNRHVGTVTGATWGSQGRNFGGVSDNISIPDHTSLKTFTNGFTILMWIKPAVNNMTNNGLIFKGTGSTNGDYAITISTDSKLSLYINNASRAIATQTAITNTNKWYYVVGWYDLASAIMWADFVGQTQSYSTAVATSATSLILGYYYTQDYDFQGQKGEVLIYNRALTIGEIRHHYHTSKWRYQ